MIKEIIEIVDAADLLPDTTQEILVVKNKVEWWRFYRNPVVGLWNLCVHSKNGWSKDITLTSTETKNLVLQSKEKIYGFQHKTPSGICVFLRGEQKGISR